ncbi:MULTISPECIES: RrF2 family transcriptional regulator [Alphaproteobacteria]|uniref:Rrf2 family transcriptional regulator n=2 Tax=Alphaproteobacteria TaxID=28211 RepID=A0A512HMJ8_9HYPH|nr:MULTISPECIES: Rrf2 family transcriptional regulator [Alphaproteobacteria]GEO86677.1 Rrf2 family transcriptional regulator [Ciceribacter naphthalenivorans]GLR23593.1 Rrf2 family transcriptional regulator [Ciceribacter naphthalenivorans]GLT06449.1 Rrf2 family transcriptional regulator [Sphingomonas psychrolutea]
MRITMRTNLAIRTLMFCAVNPDVTVRKSDIAVACNASENHLAQVIRTLGQHGFIDATRGRHGGIQLMRDPAEINIGGVFRIFEADLPFAECFSKSNTCPLVDACWLRNAIGDAVDAFYNSLDKVLLSDLVTGNDALAALLRFHAPPRCRGSGREAAIPPTESATASAA